MLELNDLLAKAGIDPAGCMVMRHRPTERALRQALMWLAEDQPRIYNAYQCSHGPVVEKSLAKAKWLVSFIGNKAGQAIFVGLYSVNGFREVTEDQFWRIAENKQLRELGTRGPVERKTTRWFDLRLSPLMSEWKGRLVVTWPGIERSWWRWSDRNSVPVLAIQEDSALVREMPEWSEIVLQWAELESLPARWRGAMSQWRGVYLIIDEACGKQYVGSAYGRENILGRWLSYSRSGHGGNVELRDRDPRRFRFTILQLVAQDMPADEVIRLEGQWKRRLGSIEFGLNRN